MAINTIPGVGPTNADIAAAVAAPSAATIAAAVAAPSAATIASTVSAPSSATIATAVAAAVPTISAINTAVSSNAPSPNNWVFLGSGSLNNVNSASVSFSSYKQLRIHWRIMQGASAQAPLIRLNGDSATNYSMAAHFEYNSANSSDFNILPSSDSIRMILSNLTANNYVQGWMEVYDAASTTAHKQIKLVAIGYSSGLGGNAKSTCEAAYRSNSAITSVSITGNGGTAFSTDTYNAFYVFGAN